MNNNQHQYLDQKYYVGQKYKAETFLSFSNNTLYLDRYIRSRIREIELLYTIREIQPRENGKDDNISEFHFMRLPISKLDISERDLKKLYIAIQRPTLYPVILILDYEDKMFCLMTGETHKGKTANITVVDRVIKSGWLNSELLENLFGKIRNIINLSTGDISSLFKQITRQIKTCSNIGDITFIEADYEQNDQIEFLWFQYMITKGYQDFLFELYESDELPLEPYKPNNLCPEDLMDIYRKIQGQTTVEEMKYLWDEIASIFGNEIIDDFYDEVKSESYIFWDETQKEENIKFVKELSESYHEHIEEAYDCPDDCCEWIE